MVLGIANMILEYMNKEEYSYFIFSQIKKDIFELTKTSSHSELKMLTEAIIFEFIFQGFSIAYIKKLIENIFSLYSFTPDGNIYTHYPHKTINTDEINGSYQEKLKEELDNLTIENRFDRFIEILQESPKDYYFVFYVKGLHLLHKIEFSDVIFYNPLNEPQINNQWRTHEIFGKHGYEHGANAMTLVHCKEVNYGMKIALQKISEVCDFLRLTSDVQADFEVVHTEYIAFNSDKNNYISSVKCDNDFMFDYAVDSKKQDFLKLAELYITIFNDNQISEKDKHTLKDTLRFYRKAFEANDYEEKLLNYWICLERIFTSLNISLTQHNETKFNKINQFVQTILLHRFIYQNGWRCFNMVNKLLLTKHGHRGKMQSELNLSNEIQEKSGLGERKAGTTIKLKDFISSISDIKNNCDNFVLIDILEELNSFYTNHQTAENIVKKKKHELRNELLMLYRQRNQIVHNASYDKNLMEFYIAQIKSITTIVLCTIVYSLKNAKSLEKVLLNLYIDSEKNIYSLLKDKDFNFIDIL